MKIERQHTEISGSNELKPQRFKVEDTVMLAQLLSNMYSNPIAAVIREYSCNGIDSHIAANNPDKIVVSCPTQLDPTFSVRDFGTGMTHEQMLELFSSYGSSSKRSTNSQIGGFGIGSKSGFAYTDKFVVESFIDGHKYSYIVYMDNVNGPSIELISKTTTSEPTGFNVKIGVKLDDIKIFQKEILNFCSWNLDLIKVEGFECQENSTFLTLDLGDDKKIIVINGIPGGYSCLVKMGPVTYKTSRNFGLTSNYSRTQTVLEVPIGTFDVAPDRESLIENEKFLTFVNKFDKIVEKPLQDYINSTVQSIVTPFNKLEKLNEFSRIFSHKYNRLIKTIDNNLKFYEKFIVSYKNNSNNKIITKDVGDILNDIKQLKGFIDTEGKSKGLVTTMRYLKNNDPYYRSAYIILPDSNYRRKKLFVALGRPELPVIKMSDVLKEHRKTQVQTKVREKNKNKKELVFDSIIGSKSAGLELQKPQKYLKAVNGEVFKVRTNHYKSAFKQILDIQNDEVVFVINKSYWSKVPSNWICLNDKLERKIKELKNNPKVIHTKTKYPPRSVYSIVTNPELESLIKDIDSYTPFNSGVLIILGINVDKNQEEFNRKQKKLFTITEEIIKEYPLLRNYSLSLEGDYKHYVNLMNDERKRLDNNFKPKYTTL